MTSNNLSKVISCTVYSAFNGISFGTRIFDF